MGVVNGLTASGLAVSRVSLAQPRRSSLWFSPTGRRDDHDGGDERIYHRRYAPGTVRRRAWRVRDDLRHGRCARPDRRRSACRCVGYARMFQMMATVALAMALVFAVSSARHQSRREPLGSAVR